MSDSYTKLFASITESTIVSEPLATRWLWVTLLAMADSTGCVWGSIPGLARRANISLEDTERALITFLAPDPYSRTKTNEGRRIECIDGGWRLLNHAKYAAIRNEAERRDYKREWDREHRRQRTGVESDSPTAVRQSDGSPTHPTHPTEIRQIPINPTAPTPPTPTPTPTPTEQKLEHADACLSPAAKTPLLVDVNKSAGADSQHDADPRVRVCPQQKIIDAYHAELPQCPRVKSFPLTAAKMLRTRWREEAKRQSVDWWQAFFRYVGRCPFLVGEKKDFIANLIWLVNPTNFAKVVNGNYEERSA